MPYIKQVSKFFINLSEILDGESDAEVTGPLDLDAVIAKRKTLMTDSLASTLKRQFPKTHRQILAELGKLAMGCWSRDMVAECSKRTGSLTIMTSNDFLSTFDRLMDAVKHDGLLYTILGNMRCLKFWRYISQVATTLAGLDKQFERHSFGGDESQWSLIVAAIYRFRYYNPQDPHRHSFDILLIRKMILLNKTRAYVADLYKSSPFQYEAMELYDILSAKGDLKAWLGNSTTRLQMEEKFLKWIAEGKLIPNPNNGQLMVSSQCDTACLLELSLTTKIAFASKTRMPRFEMDESEYAYANEYLGDKTVAFPVEFVKMLSERKDEYDSLVCHSMAIFDLLLEQLPEEIQFAVKSDPVANDIFMYQMTGVAYAPRGSIDKDIRVNFKAGGDEMRNCLLFFTERSGAITVIYKGLDKKNCALRIRSLKAARNFADCKRCVMSQWGNGADNSTEADTKEKSVDIIMENEVEEKQIESPIEPKVVQVKLEEAVHDVPAIAPKEARDPDRFDQAEITREFNRIKNAFFKSKKVEKISDVVDAATSVKSKKSE